MSAVDHLETRPAWGHRLDGIEGLRAVAALSVLFGHLIILLRASEAPSAILGDLTGLLLQGLTLFFALSGFLLYRSWVTAVIRERPGPSTPNFYRNRVLRIWPAYVVILVGVGFVLGTAVTAAQVAGSSGVTGDQIGRLSDPGTFFANLFIVQGWIPDTVMTGLGPSWSLVPEVQFYIVLPALGALALWLAPRTRRWLAAALPALALLVIGEAGRIWSLVQAGDGDAAHHAMSLSGATWHTVIYRSLTSQGDMFAFGMLAAVVVVASDTVGRRAVRTMRVVAWVLLVLATLGVLVIRNEEQITPLFGLLCACVIVLLRLPGAGTFPRACVRLLETAPLRLIGLCSYSVYLWHFGIIWFLRLHVDAARFSSFGGFLLSTVFVLTPTLVLAGLTYRFIELPAMRRKKRTDVPAP